MADTVYVTATFKVTPGKEAEFIEAGKAVCEATRKEEGCIYYDLVQDQEDGSTFQMVEKWTSAAALDTHLKTDHVGAFGKACTEGGMWVGGPVIQKLTQRA
mmetsp:Transcript_9068/g.21686  ORF Transcript_9068/g.21686 Transcript_9068/m.21686 type:complete len:101 (-) Transcript_9068:52-354(-)